MTIKDDHKTPGLAALFACLIICFNATSVVLAEFKTQVIWPDDPFLSDPFDIGGEIPATVRWAKFTVLLEDPETIYWQDSNEYERHYNFALNEIPEFAGLSAEEFNERTLTIEGQEAILGGVLFNLTQGEIGIEFVGRDPYPAEFLVPLYQSVTASIAGTYLEHNFYFPTSEQHVLAQQESANYARENITVSSIDRWLTGNVVYSSGWALGFLREIPSEEIADAYADGRLDPSDILLTDRLPSEIPFLSGILTRSSTTPNSHPVILARGYGVPLAFASDANLVASVEDLINQRILPRLNRDEVEEVKGIYRSNTGRELFDDLGVFGRSFGDLSGDDRLLAERLLLGRPRNQREEIEVAAFAIHQQQTGTDPATAWRQRRRGPVRHRPLRRRRSLLRHRPFRR